MCLGDQPYGRPAGRGEHDNGGKGHWRDRLDMDRRTALLTEPWRLGMARGHGYRHGALDEEQHTQAKHAQEERPPSVSWSVQHGYLCGGSIAHQIGRAHV